MTEPDTTLQHIGEAAIAHSLGFRPMKPAKVQRTLSLEKDADAALRDLSKARGISRGELVGQLVLKVAAKSYRRTKAASAYTPRTKEILLRNNVDAADTNAVSSFVVKQQGVLGRVSR